MELTDQDPGSKGRGRAADTLARVSQIRDDHEKKANKKPQSYRLVFGFKSCVFYFGLPAERLDRSSPTPLRSCAYMQLLN